MLVDKNLGTSAFIYLVQSTVNAGTSGLQQLLPDLVNWYHCWTVRRHGL